MFTVTLRSLMAHRLRVLLTTVSIALGVSFLAGTFVLTDTAHKAFHQLFGKISKGTSAVVRMDSPFSSSVGSDRAPIAADVLNRVRSVPGVRAASGDSTGYALLTNTHGKSVLAEGDAPTLGMTLFNDPGLRGDVQVATGRAPHGIGEVVIDKHSASNGHIPLGSSISILTHGPTRRFTVVGTVTFGESTLGGTTAAYFDEATAQRVLGVPNAYNQIVVAAVPGVTQAELVSRLADVTPAGGEAVTGQAVTDEFSKDVDESLGFITALFSVFAGIALFVGSFIIWNTFTMVVAQRTREIALLRAVGATRSQVMRSLIVEALLLGAGASAIGLALGVGVAKALTALMGQLGFSLPSTSTVIEPRTVWLSIFVGTLVTVTAAVVPAIKATRVLPVEALRDAAPGGSTPSVRRSIIGTVLLGGGAGTLFAGLFGGGGIKLVGLGVLGVVLGATVLGPVAVRPMARVFGWPLRRMGPAGELAEQNAMRNPKRTAATAAALMVGLTLVVAVGVFAASLKASIGGLINNSTHAQLFVARASVGAAGFSPQVAAEVARVPGVRTASPTGFGQAHFAGTSASYSAVDPATVERVVDLHLTAGSAEDLGTTGVLVSDGTAREHHWRVGSSVPAEFATAGKRTLQVTGVFTGTHGFLDGDYVLSTATQRQVDHARLDTVVLVGLAAGADRGEVQKRISAALADHPDAKVMTSGEYADQASGMVDKLLILVTVLLMLAVIIALLGIVNTLALSVFERTRELGLLRAIGMTRGQVQAMVRWESVIIALIGAVTGAALGIGIGVALARALRDDGIESVSVPVWQLALYVAAAAAAGILAAIGPGRSASKVDVLKAVVAD